MDFYIDAIYPYDDMTFDTHTEIQNNFMDKINLDGIDSALQWLDSVKQGNECTVPEVLTFKWTSDNSEKYLFELSKNAEFDDSYKVYCSDTSCDITNLEVGVTYFWRVNKGKVFKFNTKNNLIRFIKIDGALNVRDIGGNKIKQGLIYRGSDLSTNYKITEVGKDAFVNVLKIKNEVELRKERAEDNASVVGNGVGYKRLPYRPYKEIFEEEHKKGICDIMEFLSDENNYPMYVHCLGGADRTGMIAFFLRALAGESDEFIHMDYELTSLSTYAYGLSEGVSAKGFRNRNNDYYTEFLELLDVYAPGETLNKKVKLFLLDCGVELKCIEKILRIICK